MKRSFILLFAMLISFNTLVISYASYTASITCEEGEALVCFEISTHSFHIEEDATLKIYVKEAEYGEALVYLWNQSYPNFTGRLTYTTDASLRVDLRYLSLEEAGFKSENWLTLESPEQYSHSLTVASELNHQGLKFVEMSGEGFAFIANLTYFDELGILKEDRDLDGRIDSIDTYDKLKGLDLNELPYVISLLEPYGFYPYLSAYGWHLFDTYNAYEPGFEKDTLLRSLTWFSSLKSMSYTDETLAWAYPSVLETNDFGFSMVASWMFVDELEEKHQADWQVSAFPNVVENLIPSTLLTDVYGFVISKDSAYPSASQEALRLIRSLEGQRVFMETSDEILLSSLDELNQLNIENSTRLEFSKAFVNAYSQPMIAFKNKNTQAAFELYFELDIMSVMTDLYQQNISPREAQLELISRADAWLYEHEKEIVYDQYQ